MKRSQNPIRFLLLSTICLAFSIAAYADSSTDPRIIIRDAEPGISVTGPDFSFSLPTTTDGFFTGTLSFTNDTGATWTSLLLSENTVAAADVSCTASDFFNFCLAYTNAKNPSFTNIFFANVVGFGDLGTGILPGEFFNLDFLPIEQGGISWPAGTSFTGHATMPEPGSMELIGYLLMIGLAAATFGRKSSVIGA
jgi:hypothetical protein